MCDGTAAPACCCPLFKDHRVIGSLSCCDIEMIYPWWLNNSVVFVCLQPQRQAVQDVEKAVSLFESTGRISATVMEARFLYHRP